MAYQSTLMRHWHSSNWEQWTVNQKDRPQLAEREDSILPNCLTNYFKPLRTWHLKESRIDNFLSRVLSVCTWAIYVQSSKWLRIRQQVWPSLQIRRMPANRREKAPMFESLKAASLGAEPKHGACLRGKQVSHELLGTFGGPKVPTSLPGAWGQEYYTFRRMRARASSLPALEGSNSSTWLASSILALSAETSHPDHKNLTETFGQFKNPPLFRVKFLLIFYALNGQMGLMGRSLGKDDRLQMSDNRYFCFVNCFSLMVFNQLFNYAQLSRTSSLSASFSYSQGYCGLF